MTQYYGKLHQTGAYANIDPWESTSEYILMDGPPPELDAIAQNDGTWLVPAVDPLEARQAAYKSEADHLYMDYKAAEEEGQDAAVVENLRQTWLARRAEIKAAWPK